MKNSKAIAVAKLMLDVEAQMRSMHLWSETRPNERALASDQPFAVDTLSFEQWLQFIFIERTQALIQYNMDLPTSCAIAPMAEEALPQALNRREVLIELIGEIDELLNSDR